MNKKRIKGYVVSTVTLPDLPEYARAVLAFIREHPAHTEPEIAKGLAISEDVVWEACRRLLTRKLIIKHMRVTKKVSESVVLGVPEYYPA